MEWFIEYMHATGATGMRQGHTPTVDFRRFSSRSSVSCIRLQTSTRISSVYSQIYTCGGPACTCVSASALRDKTSFYIINNFDLVSLEGALNNGSEKRSKPLSAMKECSLVVITGAKLLQIRVGFVGFVTRNLKQSTKTMD